MSATGPLTTDQDLPDASLYGTVKAAAEWVAFVGLDGRFARCEDDGLKWRRWSGKDWRRCDLSDVNRSIRHALDAAAERAIDRGEDWDLDRLRDLNWQLNTLTDRLRPIVTVLPERLGLR